MRWAPSDEAFLSECQGCLILKEVSLGMDSFTLIVAQGCKICLQQYDLISTRLKGIGMLTMQSQGSEINKLDLFRRSMPQLREITNVSMRRGRPNLGIEYAGARITANYDWPDLTEVAVQTHAGDYSTPSKRITNKSVAATLGFG